MLALFVPGHSLLLALGVLLLALLVPGDSLLLAQVLVFVALAGLVGARLLALGLLLLSLARAILTFAQLLFIARLLGGDPCGLLLGTQAQPLLVLALSLGFSLFPLALALGLALPLFLFAALLGLDAGTLGRESTLFSQALLLGLFLGDPFLALGCDLLRGRTELELEEIAELLLVDELASQLILVRPTTVHDHAADVVAEGQLDLVVVEHLADEAHTEARMHDHLVQDQSGLGAVANS